MFVSPTWGSTSLRAITNTAMLKDLLEEKAAIIASYLLVGCVSMFGKSSVMERWLVEKG
jgi:hypothetical protein